MPVCQEKRVAAQAFAGVCKPPLGALIKKRLKGLKVQGGWWGQRWSNGLYRFPAGGVAAVKDSGAPAQTLEAPIEFTITIR